jgi:hypothetical protein
MMPKIYIKLLASKEGKGIDREKKHMNQTTMFIAH